MQKPLVLTYMMMQMNMDQKTQLKRNIWIFPAKQSRTRFYKQTQLTQRCCWSLEEDQLELQLSSELKTKLAAPWKHSLILKLVGKSLGYRMSGIWRPTGNIRQLIDIGYGFYIANFNIAQDYHHALEDGPWFVGEQYLHVQP